MDDMIDTPVDQLMDWEEIEKFMDWSFADERELEKVWDLARRRFFEADEPLKTAFSEAVTMVRDRRSP